MSTLLQARNARRAGSKTLLALTLPIFLSITSVQVRAQDTVEVPREEFEKLKGTVERLSDELSELKRDRSSEIPRRVDQLIESELGEDTDYFIPRRAAQAETEGEGSFFSGLYTKPFLYEGSSVYLGGYIDLEYSDPEDGTRTFDNHRFVPFIYADVTDRVKVATELEIEHGEEVSLEFAVIDYELWDPLNFRAGILLNPVGRFNLVHDSPIRDLTTRPLVTETVVPSVSREAGLGFFGSFAPGDDESEWSLSYELYLSTGFNGLDRDGANVITQANGLRDARAKTDNGGSKSFRDNNNNVATMGRLAFSPHAGIEAGASFHTGTYDERNDNSLTLVDLDLTVAGNGLTRYLGTEGFLANHLLQPTEVLVEYASANISRDTFARNAGVIGDMDGYYAQLNYHLFPAFLEELGEKGLVGDGAHFTSVVRHGTTDLDGAKRHRTTLGFNFRPNTSKTVFKMEYQINRETGVLGNVDNDAFWFSVATYF